MYLKHFYDWFRAIRNSVWLQINLKMINIIWFWFDSTRFRKYLSVSDCNLIIEHCIKSIFRYTEKSCLIKLNLDCEYTFSDWFGIKRNFIMCQIDLKRVITIQIWFNLTIFKSWFPLRRGDLDNVRIEKSIFFLVKLK